MSPQETSSRRYKRLIAIAAATLVAVGGTIGLAFGAGSDDTGSQTVTPPATAPAVPIPTVGTHWPTPPTPPPPGAEHGGTTRPDGGPDEGTRGPSADDSACVDPESGGNGPQHC
jgi:hypothetical protein